MTAGSERNETRKVCLDKAPAGHSAGLWMVARNTKRVHTSLAGSHMQKLYLSRSPRALC